MESALSEVAECPVCGDVSAALKFVVSDPPNRAGAFRECSVCHFFTFEPRVAERGYPPEYYGDGVRKIGGLAGGLRAFSARRRSVEVTRRAKGVGRIFDFGCGDGDFLSAMQSLGWDCYGSELAGAALERAQRRFPHRIAVGGDGFALGNEVLGGFDAISIWQVLEHLPDPANFLEWARGQIKPEGLLAIGVPDLSSWQAIVGGPHWLHLDPPRHLNLCAPAALRSLLEQSHFRVLGCRHPWLEYGPIGVIQTALNMVGFPRDRFFESMKSGTSGCAAVDLVISALLLAPAVALSAVEAAFKRSATFEIYAQPL